MYKRIIKYITTFLIALCICTLFVPNKSIKSSETDKISLGVIVSNEGDNVVKSARPIVKNFCISPYKLKLAVTKKKQLNAIFDPADSTEKLVWKSSNPEIVKVNSKGRVKAVGKGTAIVTAYSKSTGITRKCTIETYYDKQIAITFDDGPGKYTDKLLDYLKKSGARATFFVVGTNVENYPKIVKRIKDEGHEIGNHTYNHAQLTKLSSKAIKTQIKKTNKLVKNACGSKPTLIRPPYGAYNNAVLDATSLPIIIWSVDPQDWKYRDADYVKKSIIKSAFDGAIVLVHDIHSTSVDGAIAAMKALKNKGYELVTVTELLERNGDVISAGNAYRKAK